MLYNSNNEQNNILSEIKNVKIKSGNWSWLKHYETILFTLNGDEFIANKHIIEKDNNKIVGNTSFSFKAKLILELIKLSQTKDNQSLLFTNSLINREWLTKKFDNIFKKFNCDHNYDKEKSKFQKKFTDPVLVNKAISYYTSHYITSDDYPSVDLFIYFNDKNSIHINSIVKHGAMVPWTIKFGKEPDYINYDTKISMTIKKMMPKEFPNRERLNTDKLALFIMECIQSCSNELSRQNNKINFATEFSDQ